MSGKVGPECDHWSDLRLWLLPMVRGLVHLVDHCYQAVGWPGFIEYGGIGHRLPKDQSFTLAQLSNQADKLRRGAISISFCLEPFEAVHFHMTARRWTRIMG